MKKYDYIWRSDERKYAVMQGSYIVCYTETENRAKEIVRMYREKARFPFGE